MGAELCLAHDMGGWRHWGPLSVDMQPYSWCPVPQLVVTVQHWTSQSQTPQDP